MTPRYEVRLGHSPHLFDVFDKEQDRIVATFNKRRHPGAEELATARCRGMNMGWEDKVNGINKFSTPELDDIPIAAQEPEVVTTANNFPPSPVTNPFDDTSFS